MIPLSADLPLRSTVEWGQFREARPIPIRYGQAAGALLQYGDSRRLWVWADHPCVSVQRVTVEGQSVAGWDWYTAPDAAGRAVTFVEFTAAVDEGTTPVAEGLGKVHPRTGALIDNPADAIADLATFAGVSVSFDDVDEFRAACARRGLVIGGSIEDTKSVQAWLAEICASVGAVFGPTVDGRAFLYPGGALEPFASAEIDTEWQVSASATLDDLVTACVVNFDWRQGEARQAIELDAPEAVAEYGRRLTTLDLRFCRDARVAYDVAARLLAASARPQWAINASGSRTVLRGRPLAPGHVVSLAHAALPVTGSVQILGVESDVMARAYTITARAPVGAAPAVRVVRQSTAVDSVQYAAASIQTQGDQRVLILRDDAGRPIADARVVLDGAIERRSDTGGRVVFPVALMPPGSHVLDITTADAQFALTVTV